ncbi:MAG TPA: hypothetical protein VLD67_12385 [Vicinamibacterales bacterium]|nr:hypothetical protein [Vicinamibacterales bacterium]
MNWIKLVRRVPVYSGRLPRPASYDVWARGEGAAIIAGLAAGRRFSLFGRSRAARKAVWTELQRKAETGPLAAAIDRSVRQCVLAAGEIGVYPLRLPRALIDGYRLVAVPRVTWNARAFAAILRGLDADPDMQSLAGGAPFRRFFMERLFEEVDLALVASSPSLRHPVPTGEGWFIVGFEPAASWLVPIEGPERPGHFLVCEAPPAGLKSWPARRVQDAIAEVRAAVSTLSRRERDELLREARVTSSMGSTAALPPPRPELPSRRLVRTPYTEKPRVGTGL